MVKRVGNLMPLIADKANLHEAFLRAARGKSGKRAVIDFRLHLDERLTDMRQQLLDGSYRFGDYHFFTIYDPKKRIICAAPFPERVAFHAMMRICHPVFDNYQIYDSYASRIGKGTYKALERSRQYCRQYQCFAKLDVCKYFDSIHHQILIHQLCRLFKDHQLLLYFQELLGSYETTPDRGLPIGNLTSQYFANHYLSSADHQAKEKSGTPAMVRYMDDVLLFDNDKENLSRQVRLYSAYVEEELRLSLHEPIINKVCHGVPFLGYVVYPDGMRLNERSRKRFRERIAVMDTAYWMGIMNERESACRSQCLFAFIDKADNDRLKQTMYDMGKYS